MTESKVETQTGKIERVCSKIQKGKQVKESKNFVYRYVSYKVRIYGLPHRTLQQVYLRTIRRDLISKTCTKCSVQWFVVVSLVFTISCFKSHIIYNQLLSFFYTCCQLSDSYRHSLIFPTPPILCQLTRKRKSFLHHLLYALSGRIESYLVYPFLFQTVLIENSITVSQS